MEKQTSILKKYKDLPPEKIFGNRDFLGDVVTKHDIVSKNDKFDDQLALWTAYYRMFPHKFIEDYFGIILKDFQVLLLYNFMKHPNSMFIGSRGIGKTFLVALFILTVCILYPATKVVVTAGTLNQSSQILMKISEIQNMSDNGNIIREIKDFNTSLTTPKPNVLFYNSSTIKVVPASDNARGYRANILIIDEFRMVDKTIYDSVLRRFNAVKRQPPYLKNPKYAHKTERNKQIFMSSSWFKFHWSYAKKQSFLKSMVEKGVDSTYYLCSLPYQFSLMAGLNDKESLLEEMQEEDFDFNLFAMEMGCFWSGESDGSYYKYEKLLECRTLNFSEYPIDIRSEINDKNIHFERTKDEIRILSCDIALMGNKIIYEIHKFTAPYVQKCA